MPRARATRTVARTRPPVPSGSASTRTSSRRAVLHDTRCAGRQMPLVQVAMPQSHPKLQADLRIASYGIG